MDKTVQLAADNATAQTKLRNRVAELKAENKALIDANVEVANINAGLLVEVDALREALVRIDDASNHYAMTPTYSEGTLRYAHGTTRNLARAALLREPPEQETE